MAKRASRSAAAAPSTVPPMLVALSAACALALFSTFRTEQQIDAVDAAAVVLGVAALIAAFALIPSPDRLVPRDRLGAAWAAFLAWALACALLSGRGWSALMGEPRNLLGWFTLVALTLVTLTAARFGERSVRVLEFIAPVLLFGEIVATLVELTVGAMPRGSLPNSTYLGEAMLLLLPFVVTEHPGFLKLERRQQLMLAGAAIITLAASGARVATVAAVAWFLWTLVRRSGLGSRARLFIAFAMVAAAAVGALTFARSEVLGSTGVETLGLRPQMWKAAYHAVIAEPLLGYGPDGFVTGGIAVTTPDYARSGDAIAFLPGRDPHNLAVWVAVSSGVVGLALFLWAAVELVLVWRSRSREGVDVAPAVFGIVTAVVVFLTAPAAIQVLPLFAFVLGASLRRAAPQDECAASGVRAAGWAALAVAGTLAMVMTANAATRMTLEAHSAQLSPGKVAWADAAMRLWPLDPHLAYLASLHWGWVAAADPAVAALRPDLAAIERAYQLDRKDPFVAFERARTLRFYGAPPADVEAAFLATFERWSLYPLARAEYAVLLAQAGRDAEAREQIEIAELAKDPDPQLAKALETARAELGDAP